MIRQVLSLLTISTRMDPAGKRAPRKLTYLTKFSYWSGSWFLASSNILDKRNGSNTAREATKHQLYIACTFIFVYEKLSVSFYHRNGVITM